MGLDTVEKKRQNGWQISENNPGYSIERDKEIKKYESFQKQDKREIYHTTFQFIQVKITENVKDIIFEEIIVEKYSEEVYANYVIQGLKEPLIRKIS